MAEAASVNWTGDQEQKDEIGAGRGLIVRAGRLSPSTSVLQ